MSHARQLVLVVGSALVVALHAHVQHRLRTGLTVLGIVVGVGGVITMTSVGQGARAEIRSQVAGLGTNVIFVWAGSANLAGIQGGMGTAHNLHIADALALKRAIPLISDVAWHILGPVQVIHTNRNWNVWLAGIPPPYLAMRKWTIVRGRPITQADVDKTARVAILGQTVIEGLFEDADAALGSIVRIGTITLKVIGVLAPKGMSPSGHDYDDVVFVPFSTAERQILGNQFRGVVSTIFATTEREENLPETVEHIQDVLRELHELQPGHPDDFVIRTQYDFIKKEEENAEDLSVMMMLLMGISVLAAGIGVCNMMLFSVSERTKEIGLRMAVGARRWHIFVQFMVEAAIISVVGGIAGAAVGVAGSHAIQAMIGWPIVVSMDSIVVAFLMAVVTGLSSGLYPAHKATGLSPIEALRHE